MTNDSALLERYAKNQDAEAFAQLVERHAGLVYGTCMRVLQNPQDAEDISQECFLELARKAGTVTTSLPGWLHRVARNRAVDAVRADSARQMHEREALKQALAWAEPTWKGIVPFVDEALDQLPDKLRIPIILHYLEGLPQNEVAARLETSQATVSRNLEKGVATLRAHLKQAGLIVSVGTLAVLLSENASTAATPTLIASLGKMAISGVGGSAGTAGTVTTVAAVGGISALIGSLMATLAGKAVVVSTVAVVLAGGGSVIYHFARPFKPETRQDMRPAIMQGYKHSMQSIRSGSGNVVVHSTFKKPDGGIVETSTRYMWTFRGEKMRMSISKEFLRNDGANPQPKPGMILTSPGTVWKEEISCDGHVATIYHPARRSAVLCTKNSAAWSIFQDHLYDIGIPGHGIVDIENGAGKVSDAIRSAPRVVGREIVDGDECIVMAIVDTRRRSTGEQWALTRWYWVNPKKGCTVPRMRVWAGPMGGRQTARARADATIRNYEGGLWGPSEVKAVNGNGTMKTEVTYSPNFKLNTPVDDLDLNLTLPSGTMVDDQIHHTFYRQP